MAPSKAWMDLVDERISEECLDGNISKKDIYLAGVKKFLDYAFNRTGSSDEIKCPCIRCCNTYSKSRGEVYSHLKIFGIIGNYRFWYHHGEVWGEPETHSEIEEGGGSYEIIEEEGYNGMEELMMDLFPQETNPISNTMTAPTPNEEYEQEPNVEAAKFYRLLEDLSQPLYEGSSISKLAATVKLLNTKNLGKWSNKSFSMLVELLRKDFLPDNSTLPNSYYEAKKIMKELGLSYIKIDACHNDCMLYWKNDIDAQFCKVCNRSRWKKDKHSGEEIVSAKGKKIPEKTMRYFPIKPRLQRLYMCRKIASFCTWHNEGRVDDGVMRHPADSKAWKHFNDTHPSFASEPRNVRLCLAGDGFQPFTNMKTSYSIWPIFLVPLNLPPWLCIKQQNIMLSMLISGPEGPGDAIDIYLQPLIEELIDLWDNGVDTYDASTRKNFTLRAALLWIVHDFPAYGNLSGHSTKGRLACPVCHKETWSLWLSKGKKFCYMGHRRFLPNDHKWRKNKTSFDGTREHRGPPKPLTGDEVLQQVNDLEEVVLSKDPSKKTKISHSERGDNWLKKSIFFRLPYFSTLLLRHNLDVMHIEKNICECIIGTILNIIGKTKDNINSCLDLQEMNLKPHLHPIEDDGKTDYPRALYDLTTEQKNKLLQFFRDLKVPDSFSSNISRCVNLKERKLSGLKSHDCHVILNHILPFALRGLVPTNIYAPLVELSQFFCTLNSKALSTQQLEQLESTIPSTLCKLEMEFPPSFFDPMMHLPVHLASEALIGGPTIYRWMYQFERQIKFLKSLVRNMAHPEASIAEGYLAYEFITLCSRYLDDMETMHNRPGRINDTSDHEKFYLPEFSSFGRPLGAGKTRDLDMVELQQAHIYVLRNCDEVQPFISEYTSSPEGSQLQQFTPLWNQNFIVWFKEKVPTMQRGRYGNLTAAALAKSQYISPGLLRQQHAKRTYPNISSGAPIHNSSNVGTNGAHTSIKKATSFKNHFQVPEDNPEHGDESDDLCDRTMNTPKSKGAYFAYASSEPEDEDTDWSEWNKKAKKFLSKNKDLVDQDRMHAGWSRDDGRSVDQDGLSNNDNMETEEAQEYQHLADRLNRDKKVEKKQGRGKNKCKKVAKLKAGEKIKVRFYNKRALSKTFSRQLGRIVRDLNITPIRVKKWTDISPVAQKHIFYAIKDKFENADQNIELDVYENEIMEHARDLWNNWRGDLNRHFVKPARNMQHAIKNCPQEIPKADWEWLVKEHFYSKEFTEKSKRNSKNRSSLKIHHHSGSKPFRQIIWDNGGNQNKPPSLDTLFSITHTKGGTFVDSETSSKHAQIQKERLLNPSLSNVELVDKCFPSTRRDHIVGYDGGIKARDLRSLAITKAELVEKLAQSEQERQALQDDNQVLHEENRKVNNRMSRMEEEWAQMKKYMSANYSQPDSPGSAGTRYPDEDY